MLVIYKKCLIKYIKQLIYVVLCYNDSKEAESSYALIRCFAYKTLRINDLPLIKKSNPLDGIEYHLLHFSLIPIFFLHKFVHGWTWNINKSFCGTYTKLSAIRNGLLWKFVLNSPSHKDLSLIVDLLADDASADNYSAEDGAVGNSRSQGMYIYTLKFI